MSLQCGIVGLPNVGKSTLFNALSSARAEVANYPFCTIEPNVGVITVPDPRLIALSNLVKPSRTTSTVIEFVDIAGLVKGASQGEGLGNRFLANIRDVDAIIHVLRCFEDPNIAHVAGRINPVFDKEVVEAELQLKDLETLDKRLLKLESVAKSGDVKARKEQALVLSFKEKLESGQNTRSFGGSQAELELINDLQLLTAKPVIYLANVDEAAILDRNHYVEQLETAVQNEDAQVITICASLESQIAELDPEEQNMFLAEFGLVESGLNRLIKASYDLLDLITYFTASPKEVRAWTITRGLKALRAAGEIHTDFERGFIKAEVIKLSDYQKYKTEAACKEAGKMHLQGKEYVVEDGDVILFRFNV